MANIILPEELEAREKEAFQELLSFASALEQKVARQKFVLLITTFGSAVAMFVISLSVYSSLGELFQLGEARAEPVVILGIIMYISLIPALMIFYSLRRGVNRDLRALKEISEVVDESYTLVSEELTPVEKAKAKIVMSRL